MNNDDLAKILGRKGYGIAASVGKAGDQGAGRDLQLQKLKTDNTGKGRSKSGSDNKPKKGRKDALLHPQYRITITFNTADHRVRDGFGMAESVADALIAATRKIAAP